MTLFRRRCVPPLLLRTLLALSNTPPPASAGQRLCNISPSPSVTIKTCTAVGLDANNRLAGCDADEACVASSALSPQKFSPPWTPDALSPECTDPARAFRALAAAIEEQADLTVLTRDDATRYLLAIGKSAIPLDGTDEIEFIVIPQSGSQGCIALYRSATRQSVFVYPLQQPLNNQAAHSKRLSEIRTRLGWVEVGGLASDSVLEANMAGRQVRNFLGLQFQGVKSPDFDEDDL